MPTVFDLLDLLMAPMMDATRLMMSVERKTGKASLQKLTDWKPSGHYLSEGVLSWFSAFRALAATFDRLTRLS